MALLEDWSDAWQSTHCEREAASQGSRLPNPGMGNDSGELADAEALELIGTVLDRRYRIERLLAKGGMGAVYVGRHVVLHSKIALKLVPLSGGADAKERFLREARLACTVRHLNLVQILDCGILSDCQGYLIMELLRGKTLADVLAEGPMDICTVCKIGAQIACGLRALHKRGIVHCDVKPQNIVLVAQGELANCVKIVDFGIAQAMAQAIPSPAPEPAAAATRAPSQWSADPWPAQELCQTWNGTIAGTPHYMSPEQCQGQRLDGRSDIYSLGCMLYEMLTGRVPFPGDTPDDILDAHLTAPVPPMQPQQEGQAIPRALQQLVLQMLAKAPELRLALMSEVERLLCQEADPLRIQRGEKVLWARDELQWLLHRHAKSRQPQLGNSLLLRRMVAVLSTLLFVQLGHHMQPMLRLPHPLPRPPRIAAAATGRAGTGVPVQRPPIPAEPPRQATALTLCTVESRADTAPASASPDVGSVRPPSPPAQ